MVPYEFQDYSFYFSKKWHRDFFNVFIFDWGGAGGESMCMSLEVAETEKETQNLKQAPVSELSAQSLMQGSNSRAMRS